MGSVNCCMFVGNLGRDAEVRYTSGGQAIARFSMACTEQWNGKDGERHERTEWVNVDVWGRTAEALGEYLVKGKQVFVQGKLQTDEYTDKDGQKRKATKVRADRVVLLGGGRSGDRASQRSEEVDDNTPLDAGVPLTDDDIPF
jgi:single-strand DNA-binding protein